jgi:glycosyltransferase involved in cell wall biosynthesis
MIKNKISVIIPTLASSERFPVLKRAISSVRNSSVNPVKVIVVVNGGKYDPLCLEWLTRQEDVVLKVIDRPSAPFARYVGRCLVDTPFFATLDDDDEYLAGAIDQRIIAMQSTPAPDLVVTNGFFNDANNRRRLYFKFNESHLDPLKGILIENWLNADNALYRTETVDDGYFLDYHPFIEFTWLGYRLAIDGKVVRFLDEDTCVVNCTKKSLSKTQQYYDSHLSLFERMIEISPNRKIKNIILKKTGEYYHDRSDLALREKRFKASLVDHLRSIFLCGQIKYFFYTRKILIGKLRHLVPFGDSGT